MVLDTPAPPNLLQQPLLPSQPHFSHPHRRDPRRYLPISLPLHAFALLALCSSWTQTNAQNTCLLLHAQGNRVEYLDNQPTTTQAALVFPMWLSALTMEITEEFNEVRDPTFSWQLETAHYHRSKTFCISNLIYFFRFRALFFVLLAAYIIYIFYLTAKVST